MHDELLKLTKEYKAAKEQAHFWRLKVEFWRKRLEKLRGEIEWEALWAVVAANHPEIAEWYNLDDYRKMVDFPE